MNMRRFHLGDVLSITADRLVSPRHTSGVHDILNFMSGESLFTHQLGRVVKECAPYLLKQFPGLDSPQMQFALGELVEMLKTPSGKKDPEKLVTEWMSKVISGKYGINLPLCGEYKNMLDVERLQPDVHERIDPKSELAERFHPDRITELKIIRTC